MQTSEVHERVLGQGIDNRNAENQLMPGFWETLLNASADGEIVKKRTGYQQLGGYLPFRVQSIEALSASTQVCFNLDSYVDLSRLRSSPLFIKGTVYDKTLPDPFPIDYTEGKYYSGFDVSLRRSAVANVAETIPGPSHGHNSWIQHSNVYESTSNTNLSNEQVYPDSHEITGSGDLETTTGLTETNITLNQNLTIIQASIDASALGPDNYYPNDGVNPQFISKPDANPLVMDFTIGDPGIDLQSSNLIISTYKRIPATNTVEKVIPDDITITGTQVDITINSTDTDDYFYVATAVPDTNVVAGQVSAGAQTVIIPNADPFTSYAVYTLSGGIREYVFPDSVVYNDETQELTIDFEIPVGSINYQIYYKSEGLRVNQLCVTDAAIVSDQDLSTVELDVYGIDPLSVMSQENRNHWLTHIDTYRSEGSSKLLTGVAGVPYELAATSLATLFPNYEEVLEVGQYITPHFQDVGVTFVEDGRGYVECTGGNAGPEVTDIAYQSGSGLVMFTLNAPDVSIVVGGLAGSGYTDNLDGTFTSSLESDLLTVQNAGYSIMNGSHSISSIVVDTNTEQIFVHCNVDGVTNSDYDETEVCGYAQIFTSPLTINSSADIGNTFVPGSSITISTETYTVRGNSFSSAEKIFLNGINVGANLSSGLFIQGSNTSFVHPVRDTAASVGEYVRGDMVKYTGLDRSIRVKDIVQLSTTPVTLSGTVLTFGSSIALNFEAGQKILVMTEGLAGGVFTVQSVTSETTLQIDQTFSSLTAGRLIGKTFELDEELSVTDTVNNSEAFTPTARWDAIQKPSVPPNFSETDQTVQYPFDGFETTDQAFIRSTMVADNMYLTNATSNGGDPVLKYDGTNISRAGLFRWEGATFVRKVVEDNTPGTGGAMKLSSVIVQGTLANESRTFTVSSGEPDSFVVGQSVIVYKNATPSDRYETTIRSVNVTDGKIVLEDVSDDTYDRIREASILKYYFRLNLVDANNNIIGSAASGSSNNYTIQMNANTTVGIKLSKPPKLPLLDYDRLEYEVYRTKQDGAVFFKVATLQITNTTQDSYIYFEDTVADSNLIEADPVSTSTVGAELATAIDEPLRAKYITSANNRLILGNLKTSPRTEVQIFRPSTELDVFTLNGVSFEFTNAVDTITYRFFSSITTGVTSISDTGLINGGAGSFFEGEWVYLFKAANTDGSPEYLGWFKATADDTINYSGPAVSPSDVSLLRGSANIIPLYSGAEFSDDDSAYQDVSVAGTQITITTKVLNAIQATQSRLENFSFSTEGRTDNPDVGKFAVRALDNKAFSLSISDVDLFAASTIFINNIQAESGVAVDSRVTTYASRMLVSFPNFPELFDRPRAIIPEDSLSVIDVNSADGQEITGIIPFFGESTSQDSRKQDIVICFKENSIYAINIATRQITKIDSRGVGCNAPNSIAAVPNGIIFAANSGIYRINRSFDVIWVGRMVDRLWKENTNLSALSLATGHVYPTEQQYRLSVPVGSDETATEVYAYDYGDEQAGKVGAWFQLNNIPSTGWASDGTESYFGSTKGRMYIIRNTGTDSDYRDDDQPVMFEGTYRAMDFGAPGRRKIVRGIVSHFRVLKTDSNTTLDVGVDLTDEFTPTTSFTLNESINDGLSTVVSSKVKSIRQNIQNQKGVYFQVKYTNGAIDTPLELCGITFFVAGLDQRGVTQAAET